MGVGLQYIKVSAEEKYPIKNINSTQGNILQMSLGAFQHEVRLHLYEQLSENKNAMYNKNPMANDS